MGTEIPVVQEQTPGAGADAPAELPAGSGGAPRDEVVEVVYDTWGSFGQYKKTVAVLVDGSVVDPEFDVPRAKGVSLTKTVTVNGREYEIELINEDSRKNAHRVARIPAEIVLAVVKWNKSASNFYEPTIIKGEGMIKAEQEEESWGDGAYRYVRVKVAYYYVNESKGVKVPVLRREIDFKKVRLTPYRLTLRVDGTRIVVSGDTYHVKYFLKEMRFRWDPVNRVWYKGGDASEVPQIVEQLKKYGIAVDVEGGE